MKIKNKLLLVPGDFRPSFLDWQIQGVLNPGGIRMRNGQIMLFVRVAEGPPHDPNESYKCPVIISRKEYKTTTETIPIKRISKINYQNICETK